jgi:NADH dehydrogenase (ubiquinone) 1 alpha subcomplex subunit 6
MAIIATAFAETVKFSGSKQELQKRTLALYRQFLRGAPTFADLYEVQFSIPTIRTKIRQEFERHRFVDDLSIQNVLYAKGHMEYQECINFWKQQAQFLKYFPEEDDIQGRHQPSNFVDKFLKVSIIRSGFQLADGQLNVESVIMKRATSVTRPQSRPDKREGIHYTTLNDPETTHAIDSIRLWH